MSSSLATTRGSLLQPGKKKSFADPAFICSLLQWPASRGSLLCRWWLTSTSPWRVAKAWSTGPGTPKTKWSSRRDSLSPSQQVRPPSASFCRDSACTRRESAALSVQKGPICRSPRDISCFVLCHPSFGWRRATLPVFEHNMRSCQPSLGFVSTRRFRPALLPPPPPAVHPCAVHHTPVPNHLVNCCSQSFLS